ncbi:Serine/threonine-protein kinase (Partial), partial [Seminavis robusta]|eukprot:Sro3560_g349180.1 Serine/threonine-protein kinase (617) ;mRNA; f:4205-6057
MMLSLNGSFSKDKDVYPLNTRKPTSLKRALAIKHGDKLFVAIAVLICMEMSMFARLYFGIESSFSSAESAATTTTTSDTQNHKNNKKPLHSHKLKLRHKDQPTKRHHHTAAETILRPRVVMLDLYNNEESGIASNSFFQPNPARKVKPMGDLDCCKQDPQGYIKTDEKPFYETCDPMADWQTTIYPTCNMLHELPLIDDSDDYFKHQQQQTKRNDTTTTEVEPVVSLLNTKGSWRTVWKVTSQQQQYTSGGEPHYIVLKTLRYTRDFNEESYQLQYIDSIAMERLTSSPYIANEYGFCGQSVLTEYAPKSGRDLIKNKKLKTWQRVQIAHDLAAALSDMHSIDYPNATNATFTHNDINIANTIQGEHGNIKFNDFNIGVRMRWNQTRPCGYPVHFNAPLWRSPEEILATNTSDYVQPDKSDVYSLGNLLFQVLTTHQPWTWLEPGGRLSVEEVIARKLAGEYPHIPSKFHGDKPGVQALYYATLACFAHDPEDRPTSYELSESLRIALDWSKQGVSKNKDDVRQLFNFRRHSKPQGRTTNAKQQSSKGKKDRGTPAQHDKNATDASTHRQLSGTKKHVVTPAPLKVVPSLDNMNATDSSTERRLGHKIAWTASNKTK